MSTTPHFKQQWYFRYEKLDKSRDSFRVFRLFPAPYSAPVKCMLIHESISALQGQYSALSYTWGEPTSQRWLQVNGTPFMVQPNLLAALKAIRKEDEEMLVWADGICINQLDTTERNHQVSLMRRIYEGAKEVRVWLGPAGEDSAFVLNYINRYADRVRRRNAGEAVEEASETEEAEFIKAFRFLQLRPYWGRAWIKQEVILAKDITIHCGSESTSGFQLFLLATLHFALGKIPENEVSNLYIHRTRVEEGKKESLEVLLKRYGRTGCSDSRDRIFSILSLASDCQGLEDVIADYSVSTSTLFFALLGIIEPQDINSMASTIQEILGIRRAQLLEYWDKIILPSELGEEMHPPKVENKVENLALSLIWAAKAAGQLLKQLETTPSLPPALVDFFAAKDFATIGKVIRLPDFMVRVYLASDPESNRQSTLAFRIRDADYCVMAIPTLFGARLTSIYQKMNDPSREQGYVWAPVQSRMTPEQLTPFMAFPQVILDESSPPSWMPHGGLDLIKPFVKQQFGDLAVTPPLEVICCIILERDRLSGDRGICVNECRYILGLYGYELVQSAVQWAEKD